jgi:hypothetical protein
MADRTGMSIKGIQKEARASWAELHVCSIAGSKLSYLINTL